MIPTQERVAFLRKIHLFHGLSDEALTAIAVKLEEALYAPGETVLEQGEVAERFFILFSGGVRFVRAEAGRERELAALVEADYFGEQALLRNVRRSAEVRASEETLLLTLDRADFLALTREVPGLRLKVEISSATHRLEQRHRFRWLEEGEVVYFLARRHAIELWRSLTGPILALLLPGILLVIYGLTASAFLLYAAGAVGLAALGWCGWRFLDWSNDYFIVTNRRVVWLEKVIGLYDSRQEAPLTSVLSVVSETDVTGRLLGYGDVVIRTYVGKIIFHSVGYPQEVEALVREYWERTKEGSRQENIAALKQAIREKLGLQPPQAAEGDPEAAAPAPQTPGLLEVLFANLFRVRFEQGASIIYRKHVFVLLKQTWLPGTLFAGGLVWLLYLLFTGPFAFGTGETVLFIFLIIFGLWWLYQYADWSNDIFQVTPDQIIDLDRTPFGRVKKNVAPLDNILSMESRREGLLQMLFNYGNVIITVGSGQLVFEDVMDPTMVQQDIDRRRVNRREKQEQDRVRSDRDRLAEFFVMYHNHADEFRQEANRTDGLPSPDELPPDSEVQ